MQALLGGTLFLFPGFAWTWALGRPIPIVYRIPIAVVVAFSSTPLVLYFLGFFLHVPITLATISFLSVAVGLLGWAAWAVRVAPLWRGDLSARGHPGDRR